MQRYEDKVIRRELKATLGRAAGMLYISGLSRTEICTVVYNSIQLAAEEMDVHAQTTKDQGGN